MFIVWGRKAVRRSLGHVADFCPMCLAERSFKLARVGMAGHVYYVTAGEGTLVGFERTCGECQCVSATDRQRYQDVSKRPQPLETLIRETFPRLREVYADALAIAQRAREAPAQLSAQERMALIRAPFSALGPKVAAEMVNEISQRLPKGSGKGEYPAFDPWSAEDHARMAVLYDQDCAAIPSHYWLIPPGAAAAKDRVAAA